jgi:hypothetical protein
VGKTRTGLRIEARVLFDSVESVNVVMKLPRIKLDSVAGMIRCSDISYDCCDTRAGRYISA